MSIHSKQGRDAITHYRVLKRFGAYTFIECRLETGRTHQIRVHMASSVIRFWAMRCTVRRGSHFHWKGRPCMQES